jgi:hypothetical protein
VTTAPDYAEPVVGWRVWAVSELDGGLRLRSLMFDAVWQPHEAFGAACAHRRHPIRRLWGPAPSEHRAPDATCRCGIYATKEVAGLAPYAHSYGCRHWTVFHRVVGRVALWGSVFEHSGGWRASHAYPVALFVPQEPLRTRAAEAVALALADYGVRVEIADRVAIGELVQTLGTTAEQPLAA